MAPTPHSRHNSSKGTTEASRKHFVPPAVPVLTRAAKKNPSGAARNGDSTHSGSTRPLEKSTDSSLNGQIEDAQSTAVVDDTDLNEIAAQLPNEKIQEIMTESQENPELGGMSNNDAQQESDQIESPTHVEPVELQVETDPIYQDEASAHNQENQSPNTMTSAPESTHTFTEPESNAIDTSFVPPPTALNTLSPASNDRREEHGLQTGNTDTSNTVLGKGSTGSGDTSDQLTNGEIHSTEQEQHPYPDTNGTGEPESSVHHPSSPESTARPRQNSAVPMPSIHEHLLQLANTKEWFDWCIVLTAPPAEPYMLYSHSLVLIRSVRLRKLMERQPAGSFGDHTINIYAPRPILPHAFEAALRFFYSDTVLSSDALLLRSTPDVTSSVRSTSLDYVLSYSVAGLVLGAEPVIARGASLLANLVDWDLIEPILKEASDLLKNADEQSHAESIETKAIGNSWRETVLRFCFENIQPTSFRLDSGYTSSLVPSRLGQLEDARAKHNPALASMVFGSMPSSADLSPTSPQSEIIPVAASIEDQIASNVILNASFDELRSFSTVLNQRDEKFAHELLTSVISERESRRVKVISNRAVPNKQRMANSTDWDIAGFREYYEDGSVHRERVGFLLPTKTR